MSKNKQCDGSDATGTNPRFIACGTYKVPPGFTVAIENGNVCIKKKQLTEFEKAVMKTVIDWGNNFRTTTPEFVCERAPELLAVAQKELEKSQWIKDMQEWWYNKGHLEGYAKGQKDAEERHNEATSFRMPMLPGYPPCYWGGPCTNPQHDCVDCPRQGASGVCKTNTKIE